MLVLHYILRINFHKYFIYFYFFIIYNFQENVSQNKIFDCSEKNKLIISWKLSSWKMLKMAIVTLSNLSINLFEYFPESIDSSNSIMEFEIQIFDIFGNLL